MKRGDSAVIGWPRMMIAAATLLLATVVIAQPVTGNTPNHAERDAVLAVINQLREAIRTGDATLAERSLDESVLIYEQGHVESSRAEYMGHHFKEDVAYAKLVPSKVVGVNVIVSGTMALVTATSTTDGVYKDKPVKSAGVETYVLRLQDGKWRIVHIHWSSRKRA